MPSQGGALPGLENLDQVRRFWLSGSMGYYWVSSWVSGRARGPSLL